VCGIVAYRGRERASDFLLAALHRLEYRGYDSAGIAITGIDRDELHLTRAVGRVAVLESRFAAERRSSALGIGVGHTRWATHGGVSEPNAHPHRDCTGGIAVVHNGIIDNAPELERELGARGHVFGSQVDTEVVAHLVEEQYARTGSLVAATEAVVQRLRGTWALAVTASTSSEVVLA
jgi:glutamine---fructose-6-phosphate transaminase (isomerizing)